MRAMYINTRASAWFAPVVAITFVLSCNGSGGDVHADAGAESCGQCTVSGPVSVTGEVVVTAIPQPVRMVTADSDPTRFVSGVRSPDGIGEKLVDGPLYLTDVSVADGRQFASQLTAELWVDDISPMDCVASGLENPIAVATFGPDGRADMHGARLFIKLGNALCARRIGQASVRVSWSGFRPYE
jgi:hypothetical protein